MKESDAVKLDGGTRSLPFFALPGAIGRHALVTRVSHSRASDEPRRRMTRDAMDAHCGSECERDWMSIMCSKWVSHTKVTRLIPL